MLVAKWCLLVAFALIYVPRIFVARAQARAPGGYDNRMPREQYAKIDALGKRAHAAHTNAFESFAPFAAAVLLATVQYGAGRPVDPSIIDGLAAGYVALRAVYVALYIGDKSTARSSVWGLSTLCTAGIFFVALLA
jgi:uncharacterized MAPEG superfamily protein